MPNDTPRRIGLELSGGTNVRPSTERRPSGRGSESPASRSGLAANSSRTRRNAAARRDEVAPGSDDLLDRLQRAAEQDAGGKHRTDRGKPLDHQIGAKAEDQRLHRKPQEADHALHGGGAIARGDLALEHPVAIAAPAPQQAVGHAHGAHHLGVAQAHFGEAVVARGRLVGFRQRRPDEPFVEQRHQDEKNRAPQRKRAERRDAARRSPRYRSAPRADRKRRGCPCR